MSLKYRDIKLTIPSRSAPSSSVGNNPLEGETLTSCHKLSARGVVVPKLTVVTVNLVHNPVAETVPVYSSGVKEDRPVSVVPSIISTGAYAPESVSDSLQSQLLELAGRALESIVYNQAISSLTYQVHQAFWDMFMVELPSLPERALRVPFNVVSYETALKSRYHTVLGTAPSDPIANAIIDLSVGLGVGVANVVIRQGAVSASSIASITIPSAVRTKVRAEVTAKTTSIAVAEELAASTTATINSTMSTAEIAAIMNAKAAAIAAVKSKATTVRVSGF